VRKVRGLIIPAALVVSAGAAGAENRSISWEHVPDAELRTEVEKLAGPDVIDCGVVDIRKRKAGEFVKRRSLECIANARQRGLAVKFGMARLWLGRDVLEVYVRTKDGQMFLLSHGPTALEDAPSSWVQRCAFVDVSTRTLLISGMDCANATQISKQPE
jgi:hypothetical protein